MLNTQIHLKRFLEGTLKVKFQLTQIKNRHSEETYSAIVKDLETRPHINDHETLSLNSFN